MSHDPLRWHGSDVTLDVDGDLVIEVVDVVVDLDVDGAILGVEALGLVALHPGMPFVGQGSADLAVVVDEEADATYIRLGHGRSLDQVVRTAVLVFDRSDRLKALSVRMEL